MTILAIGAHPDDIEFGCGGTLRLANLAGHHVVHIVVTSGEAGGLISLELAKTREAEALASATALGTSAVHFLREPDGLTFFRRETKLRLIQLIREIKPDRVFIHATCDLFPDHRVVSRLSQEAILAAAGPWYLEGDLQPHVIKEVFGFEVWHPIPAPAAFVDITKVLEKKLEALRCHRSQIASVDYLCAAEGLAHYRGAMSLNGGCAEAFEILKGGVPL